MPGRHGGNSDHDIRPCLCYAVLCVCLLLHAVPAAADENPGIFLSETAATRLSVRFPRPSYKNYAFDIYQNYADHSWSVRGIGGQHGIAFGVERPRTVVDLMGNYLTTGYDLYTWEERRQPEQRTGSELFKDWSAWQLVFTNVAVASDGYGEWGYQAIVGDGLIARLSPLTLSKTDLYGLRVDLSTPHLKLTGLGSRIARPNRESYLPSENAAEREVDHSTMLVGGRAQVDWGQLRVGFNGANLHTYNSTQQNNSIKGLLRRDQPLYSFLVVRFSDEVPGDGLGGAAVQDVRLVVNGEVRSDIAPHIIRKRAGSGVYSGRALRTGFIASAYNKITGPRPYYRDRELPLYADFLYRLDHEAGEDVSNVTLLTGLIDEFQLEPPGQILRADGDKQLIYLFDLRNEPHVESVEVEAVVGNDYKVEWAGVYLNRGSATAERYEDRYSSTIYYPAMRSRGRVEDLSNLSRKRFSVGENTAIFTYSADMELVLPWMDLSGEIARSALYSRYPAQVGGDPMLDEGPRSVHRGSAYFLNGLRRFQRGIMGFELFSMNPDFTTKMPTYLRKDFGYNASRGYDPLAQLDRNTVIWSLVQDNEDGDRWPDILVGNVLGSPYGSSDLDGIFPGQDADYDGLVDTDRNLNGTPDYDETFLLFEVEPNEYVYGLDRNNNNEPDIREDDWQPDYPYDHDQRGYHLFGQLDLTPAWSLGLGRYAVRGLASGGRNRSAYALLTYRWLGRDRVRELFFENNLRRVKDDIADPYNQYSQSGQWELNSPYDAGFTGIIARIDGSLLRREDVLLYQDSYVNETYLEGDLRPLSGLQVVQKLRLRINWQQGGLLPNGMLQRPRRLDFWTTVSRIQYTWALGKLTLMPQYKLMLLRLVDRDAEFIRKGRYASRDLESVTTTVPILRISYQLLPRTKVQLGLQGFGTLPYKIDDHVRALEGFEQYTTTATVTNRSRYFGYDLHTIAGFSKERLELDSRHQSFRNRDGIVFFIRALMGFTEYGRML